MNVGPSTLALCLLVLSAFLSGCGWGGTIGGTGAKPSTYTAATPLSGNWLLTEHLPSLFRPVSGQTLSLAATFSVNSDTEITVVTDFLADCTSSGYWGAGGGQGFSGTLNSTGQFNAVGTSAQLGNNANLKLQGSTPPQAGAQWPGSYTLEGGQSICPISLSGQFTATHLADVSGTYTGNVQMNAASGALPLSISLTTLQGATAQTPDGSTYYKSSALSGTVNVTGSPCFKNGTTTKTPSTNSGVSGGSVLMELGMDDGSVLRLQGEMLDNQANQIQFVAGYILGGACGGQSLVNGFVLSK